jgi:hypothetical protein
MHPGFANEWVMSSQKCLTINKYRVVCFFKLGIPAKHTNGDC